jgi:hypothetical protein
LHRTRLLLTQSGHPLTELEAGRSTCSGKSRADQLTKTIISRRHERAVVASAFQCDRGSLVGRRSILQALSARQSFCCSRVLKRRSARARSQPCLASPKLHGERMNVCSICPLSRYGRTTGSAAFRMVIGRPIRGHPRAKRLGPINGPRFRRRPCGNFDVKNNE